MQKIKKLYKVMTSREMLRYMLFGIGTAGIDFFVAKLCYQTLPFPKSALLTTVSNVLAWAFSVTFAFITNKLYVFKSRDVGKKNLWIEVFGFYGARFLSLVLSLVCMVFLVDIVGLHADISKLAVTVFVIIFNFVFSKLFIFKQRK